MSAQSSFFDPSFVCPSLLEEGSLTWLLAHHGTLVCPSALVSEWERSGQPGRDPWPFRVMAACSLLRFSEEGMSRRGAARRLRTDGAWRAAAGLSWQDATPDESRLRSFERFLAGRGPTRRRRMLVWFEGITDACRGVLGKQQLWVIDSTPMHCHGAVVDTLRYLGDGARSLARVWSRRVGCGLNELASKCPLLLARSTKGHFLNTDWADPDQRAEAVTEVARTALWVAEEVLSGLSTIERPGTRKRLARQARALVKKVQDDLEQDAEGRLVVARRVGRDRRVSRTDPQARHGRKSKSKTFNGFKLHVLAEALSGLIATVCVTPGNIHDSFPANRLIGRAKALFEDLERVLGDVAYSGVELHLRVRGEHDVDLLARPQPQPSRTNDRFRKEDFDIDFVKTSATCPAGVTTTEARWNGGQRMYCWPKATCQTCPLSARCLYRNEPRKRLVCHREEESLRALRARWPRVRTLYRQRSQGERPIHSMTRHGCRKARAWGLTAVQVQAHCAAAVVNLKLLAAVFAAA